MAASGRPDPTLAFLWTHFGAGRLGLPMAAMGAALPESAAAPAEVPGPSMTRLQIVQALEGVAKQLNETHREMATNMTLYESNQDARVRSQLQVRPACMACVHQQRRRKKKRRIRRKGRKKKEEQKKEEKKKKKKQ